jgi:hypothetical protein
MAVTKIEKADVWAGEVRDETGGLAAALAPLRAAGADFTYLIARRRPEWPGTGIVFLGGLRGARQLKAAHSVGIRKTPDVATLRVEAIDKPGLVHQLTSQLAAGGINLRAVSAMVVAKRCMVILAFDSATDRDRAAKLLRGNSRRSEKRPPARRTRRRS